MQCGGYWKSYTCKCSYKSLHSHVAGLHGCYSLLLTMVSVPPWLFDIYLWLFLWICKDNPSPLRSPHRPYRPWLHNRPLMFDLVRIRSNTQRGLRCWPVQWASLPAHDSRTPWHTKWHLLHVLDDSTSSIQVLDISWHFMTFRAWSLIEVPSTLDTSLFQLPDFQTQTKSHSPMCNVSSDKEIPATASHWTFKQVGSLSALVVSRYLYVSCDLAAACPACLCLWFHVLDRLTPPVHELPAKQQFAPRGLRSWPSPTSMTLMVMKLQMTANMAAL